MMSTHLCGAPRGAGSTKEERTRHRGNGSLRGYSAFEGGAERCFVAGGSKRLAALVGKVTLADRAAGSTMGTSASTKYGPERKDMCVAAGSASASSTSPARLEHNVGLSPVALTRAVPRRDRVEVVGRTIAPAGRGSQRQCPGGVAGQCLRPRRRPATTHERNSRGRRETEIEVRSLRQVRDDAWLAAR